MKKFEVGKIYKDKDSDIEIIITKRTDKNVFFKFVKSNYWEEDIQKTFRKKIYNFSLNFETIAFANHHSATRMNSYLIAI